MKKSSMQMLRTGINFHGISSCTYNKIPRPLALRSTEGNSIERNDSNNFVSDIINTSIFTTARKVSKCRVFLVHIFPHSDWIRRDTSYLSVFCSNAGKYGPEKTPYLDTFHTVYLDIYVLDDYAIWTVFYKKTQMLRFKSFLVMHFYSCHAFPF